MINKGLKNHLYNYFRTKLGMRDYRNNWMKGTCPYCGKRDKFGVNIALNRCNCFYCGGKLKPLYLVMDLEELANIGETLRFLGNHEGLDYYEKSLVKEIDYNVQLDMPEGYRPLMSGKNQLAKSARAYIKSRGFDPEEMTLKGWGYGSKGKFWGYIIIPVFFKSQLVYYTTRRFLGNGPKFLNLSFEEYPIGKNLIIYNHEALFIYEKIRLVESIMNAETLGENAIAINGKNLSPYQFSQILKSPTTHCEILLDRDAWIHGIHIALKLSPYKHVKLVNFKDHRDVNDLGKLKTLKRIFKNRYLTYNECLKLKNEYERSVLTYN